MAWWVAEFKNGEQMEVNTTSDLKYEAWQKVSRMFPGRELVSLKQDNGEIEEEIATSLEGWNYRS